ncbi:MAG: integron integrase, partial [Deltaproteobacteria bacterium]|nr:integron integrase [Deltaproteobacteria bacterium]
MIQIAADLAKLYTSFMEQKGLKTDQHRYYVKWLRYYLDFCHKYKFKCQNKESLSAFLEKLKE